MYSIQVSTRDDLERYYNDYKSVKTILQHPLWSDFRHALGEEIAYYSVYKDDILYTVFQIEVVKARRGTLLQIAHGPLIEHLDNDFMPVFTDMLRNIAHQYNASCVRITPIFTINMPAQWIPCPSYQPRPERTILLDIHNTEDEILQQMKKTTRYEVRLSERSGLVYTASNTQKDIDIFWKLHQDTVSRQSFTPFSKHNTDIEMAIFKDNAEVIIAYKDDIPLAASVILYDKHCGYYHQGASIRHKLPVSYGTLWYAIKRSKERGCSYFNFWGVSEADNQKHPWYGLSEFKRGFGGKEMAFSRTYDIPTKYTYWVLSAIEYYRRWKKGY